MAATLEQAVRDKALSLGFTLAGVTTPAAPPHLSTFQEWLAAGRQGQMAYLATERARACRADPLLILPACKCILVLGTPYCAPGAPDPGPLDSRARVTAPGDPAGAYPDPQPDPRRPVHAEATLYGRMAAYAWGADYHDVLPRRMEELVHFIEAQVGRKIPHRLYTDTGPILERDLAQRAGLGWIGKNTCLINPRAGSYFLLSEILLGIELEPDTPFTTDQCGTCRRCVDACPTLCIQPDRTLDARRCVSYLTIELKDDIPPGLRGELGDWLFGCDICQMVCPWNRFAAERGDDAFSARPGSRMPVLAEALAMTDGDFGRRFRDSPVRRAKRRGYLRNVAVALGNQAGDDALPALWRAAEAEETMVRTHAAWAIEQIRQRSDA